jgi:Ice-binding-like
MIDAVRTRRVRHWTAGATAAGITAVMVIFGLGIGTTAWAAQPTVGLGSAAPFAVLAGTTVTNTGPTVISGSLGVSPGAAITGFPPGQVKNGSQHAADGVALQAKAALVTAYNDAAGRTPATVVSTDLSGKTLAPGVYKSASALGLTGTVTLDAHGDAKAVFIFQAGSTLITGSGSKVRLTGGASACNVFWQVGSSATLGTNTTFVGTIMALTSASIQTGTTVSGRVLARNAQVSLDNNRINLPKCAATPSPSPSASRTPTPAPSTSSGGGGAIIPSGPPQTGAGGAYHPGIGIVTTIGIVALIGSVAAMGAAIRRRREWH